MRPTINASAMYDLLAAQKERRERRLPLIDKATYSFWVNREQTHSPAVIASLRALMREAFNACARS